jgi:hypothetical protein
MPLNLASPGYVIKEVDLTLARATPSANKIGALVSTFEKGPVGTPIFVENENDLLNNFGKPSSVDDQYESWYVASSYLSYGGGLRIVRADGDNLKNSFVGTASSIKINSTEDFYNKGYDINTITNVTLASKNPGSWANGLVVALIDAKSDQIITVGSGVTALVGAGITQAVNTLVAGVGTTSMLSGYYKGIITGVTTEGTNKNLEVKILSFVNSSGEVSVDYQPGGVYKFNSGTISINPSLNTNAGVATTSVSAAIDWFDAQKIQITTGVTTTTINWNELVQRPQTTSYANARSSRFDEVHVVVIDGTGNITGNALTILEKHTNLSKAKDATFSSGSSSNWRKYLADNSSYIFGGSEPVGVVTTGFSSLYNLTNTGSWDVAANGISYECIGSKTYALGGGKNYDGNETINSAGSLKTTLSNVAEAYEQFENTENYTVDFLLMGSSAWSSSNQKEVAQALANKLISIAELRKDSLAFISPYKEALLTATNDNKGVTVKKPNEITQKLIEFYSPITSSSYGIFDSGYKYTYDRFSDSFRYVPLNGDLAGLCARNDINNFPWYSPAGTLRGSILNAVKLAYNPTKAQRDQLYSNRINPVIFSPGAGIILYGDKTALGRASAFDRINVRRLFIYLKTAIAGAAEDVLFQFNDELTRTNFVNSVEPFLRDVQSKRGIYDYIVVCDESNNTASVIDNNEFVADIYIKPAKSVNFVGLTFIATKTGVNFEEIIGTF